MSLLLWAQAGIRKASAGPSPQSYSITRTLDRTFTDTPASGGGNVSPDEFEHNGQTWELWQAIPFLGSGVGPPSVGDARVHLRNRAIGRNAMQLADMPSRIEISAGAGQSADWTGLPWSFSRPTAANKFTSPGSGNAARRGIDYEPDRNVAGQTPASLGITQGETFTVTFFF